MFADVDGVRYTSIPEKYNQSCVGCAFVKIDDEDVNGGCSIPDHSTSEDCLDNKIIWVKVKESKQNPKSVVPSSDYEQFLIFYCSGAKIDSIDKNAMNRAIKRMNALKHPEQYQQFLEMKEKFE